MWLGIVLGLLAVGLAWIYWTLRDTVHHIPGPKGDWIGGNAKQLEGKSPYLVLTQWAKQYGPVFKLHFFSRPVVVLNSFDAVYQALVSKGQDFAGRPSSFRIQYIKNNSAVVFADPSPKWKKIRKTCFSCLRAFGPGLSRIETLAMQITEDFLGEFSRSRGEPINPRMPIHNAVTKMMCLLVAGDSYEDSSQVYMEIKNMLGNTNKYLASSAENERLDKFPWLRYFGNATFKRLQNAKEMQEKLFQEIRNRTLATIKEDPHGGMKTAAQALFELIDDPNCGVASTDAITMKDVQPTVFELILAGVSTTANSMFSLINILLHYPEVKAKLQKEIDDTLGERSVTLNDRENLPYTSAVIFELFRFSSNFAIANPHKTLVDTKVGDMPIPANTQVWMNLYAVHHDEDFWGDPFVFRPERFLDDEGNIHPADHVNRKHVIPFGAGPRVCIGETLARARLYLWVVTLFQRFDLQPDPDTDELVPCDPRTYKPGLVAETQPYRVRFIQRQL